MAQRICTVEGCERKHIARGLCKGHYKQQFGKPTRYERICLTCDKGFQSSRADGKFCTDFCKGMWYSDVMRTKCVLPAHHPVMVLIAEARRPKPKPVRPDPRTARECPGCGCWFSPLLTCAAKTMIKCSRHCAQRIKHRKRRARENDAYGSWVWSDFMRIAAKFDYCCAYCGTRPDRLDPDHVVPLARGGYDSVTNLLPSCPPCNNSKHVRTLDEWAAWRIVNGRPPRATHWAPEDRRYWHLTQALISSAA